MEVSKEEAKIKVSKLVEQFLNIQRNGEESKYNEATVRLQFIEPFLEALGWNPRGGARARARWNGSQNGDLPKFLTFSGIRISCPRPLFEQQR